MKQVIEIWKRPDDMRKEHEEIAMMFRTLFALLFRLAYVWKNPHITRRSGEYPKQRAYHKPSN
jgi:hypothetical protein